MNSKDLLLPGTAKFTDGNVYSNKFALTYNDYLSDEEFTARQTEIRNRPPRGQRKGTKQTSR